MTTVNGLTADATMALVNALVQSGEINEENHLTLTTHDGTVLDLGPITSTVPDATTVVSGISRFATVAEAKALTDDTIGITPNDLAAVFSVLLATTTAAGLIEIAASGDITAGTNTTKAVTPAQLTSSITAATPAASTTVSGTIEIAGSSDITAGTNTTKAVTPAQLAAKQPLNTNLTTIAAIAPAAGDVMQYEGTAWTHRTMAQLAADIITASAILGGRLYSGSAWADTATGAKTYVGNVDPASSGTIVNGSVWFDTSGT
jgi:hypothetical protein